MAIKNTLKVNKVPATKTGNEYRITSKRKLKA